MFGRRFQRRKSQQLPRIDTAPPTLPRLHMYESDDESIQASPVLEEGADTFHSHFARYQNDEQEVMGPVTGSTAPSLAVPQARQQTTINFARSVPQQPVPVIEEEGTYDDDEALPFAATRQMASKGRQRSFLPDINTGIVMTNDKFETYRKSLNVLDLGRQNSVLSNEESEESDEEADIEAMQDERRRKKQLALARQQQEAHLSVHRQKMNKMVGGDLAATATFDSFVDDEDDVMEDVPLSILRAHGFPKALKKQSSPQPELKGQSPTPAQTPTTPQLNPVFSQDRWVGRGLVGEIAREEEAKKNRMSRSNINSMVFDPQRSPMEPSQSMNTIATPHPMLNEIRAQVQQMSELQAQLMQMSGNDQMSRLGYSRAASIRSFPHTPYTPSAQMAPVGPMAPGGIPYLSTPTLSPHYAQNRYSEPRVRAVRREEDDEEDEDEAWKKFAEKRQSLRASWMAV